MVKVDKVVGIIKACGDPGVTHYRVYGNGPGTVWQEGIVRYMQAAETGISSVLVTDVYAVRFAPVPENDGMDPIAAKLMRDLVAERVPFTMQPVYDPDRNLMQYRFEIGGVILNAIA